jgi:hypothetical protein
MRRLGVELELIGIDLEDLSQLVAEHIGGMAESVSEYERAIHGDPHGDWVVELDFRFLRERGRNGRQHQGWSGMLDQTVEDVIKFGAEQIVPMEVVSPPLPMDQLDDLHKLIEKLRGAGAKGTADSVVYAFSMQLNPEMPATDAATIMRYLQAFLCLFPWLKAHAKVDFTRRLTAYTDPFPNEYVRRICNPEYRPDLATLIDDYLDANPTRNRALDLLPLFVHLDEKRVRSVVKDRRVKARPALHYRLPNCEIDRVDWGVHLAWLDWLQVEYLVAEPDRLQALCGAYTAFLDRPVTELFDDWVDKVEPWLTPANNL